MGFTNNIAPTTNINTPSIQTSAGIVIASNHDRKSWSIQNVGTNAIFVRLGAEASTTLFHYILKGGTADSDGQGASVDEDGSGTVYSGIISIAGTTPKLVIRES